MYPQSELSYLAARKTALRSAILEQRLRCAGPARHLARPLVWFDELRLLWLGSTPFIVLARSVSHYLRR